MSLWWSILESAAQITDVCHHTWMWNLLSSRLTLNSDMLSSEKKVITLPRPKFIMANLPQTFDDKIWKSSLSPYHTPALGHRCAPGFWLVIHSFKLTTRNCHHTKSTSNLQLLVPMPGIHMWSSGLVHKKRSLLQVCLLVSIPLVMFMIVIPWYWHN